ncbi:radical SAM protein [Caldanaerobacter subterraneus]|uniref:Radical SAM protein with 4Fe4S-binding SPASM domain n=1 Tax=Caldanaerobacter subterraneus TaxID=911092 RepID=A0A4R2JUX1_9THEO|nr:SPASM domain-containing protein [Caldanaerobacter subterraneus]TCO64231.1 radical SAM protein with 4Fe4S-binding SPASM domain [Caldanaerobacter subterraneus]
MSEKIIKLCDENEVMYGASIITNGYNLTREVVEQFRNLRLSFIQITLDGPQDVHDKRRPLKSGQGTFEKILVNIEENIDIMPNISLRINVDKENVNRVNEILDGLERRGLKNKLSVYLGYVEPTNDCYVPNKCLSMHEYSKVTYMFEKVLKERGFSNNLMHKYPHLKYNFCGADSVNSMVIDPEGYIYKCWSDIGIEEYRVGNILNDTSLVSLNVDKYMEYLLYDPTMDEMCTDCKLLPICMGGCPRRRIERMTERCGDYKYVLEEYLKDIAKELLEKKQEKV